MQTGSKPIFHLEAFVAKFMALYVGSESLVSLACSRCWCVSGTSAGSPRVSTSELW